MNEQFPKELYTEKIYTFTKSELSILTTNIVIERLGQMASELINRMINTVCLPRVGITPRGGIQAIYNEAEGTFTVYTPKNFCVVCKNKAGTIENKKNWWCKDCFGRKEMLNEMANEVLSEKKE